MEIQLKKSGIETEFTKNIDLSWATENISRLVQQYTNREYILLFPFCLWAAGACALTGSSTRRN